MAGLILTPDKMGGPAHQSSNSCSVCGSNTGCACNPYGVPNYVQGANPCAPSAGNEVVDTKTYQCSTAVRTQAAVDKGRHTAHRLGYRPYRVFLVWQERQGSTRLWEEYARFELIPVNIVAMDSLDLAASPWGEDITGGVSLTEISPQQVTYEDTLKGYIDGQDWAGKSDHREFFYEIVMHERCPEQLKSERRRFYPITEPNLDAKKYQYTITLGKQKVDRSRDGVDQTIGTVNPDNTPIEPGPRLVT